MQPEHWSASAEAQIRDLPPHPIYETHKRFGIPYCLQLQGWGFLSERWRQHVHKNAGKFTSAYMASCFKRQKSSNFSQFKAVRTASVPNEIQTIRRVTIGCNSALTVT